MLVRSNTLTAGGHRCHCRPVDSPLVFEPGVSNSVGERRARRCASGVVPVVRWQPVQSALSSSGATTPTMIRKRNTAPVNPARRLPVTHIFGRWVGRFCTAHRVHDRSDRGNEQKIHASDDKHFNASHLVADLQYTPASRYCQRC